MMIGNTPNVIHIGMEIPDVEVVLKGRNVNIKQYLTERTGVIFGVPAPFSPVCMNDLTQFKLNSEMIKSQVGFLGCLSMQDPFVLKAWAKEVGVSNEMTFISDPTGKLVSNMGLMTDCEYGYRCRRFAAVISEGKVVWMGLDDDGFANNVLTALKKLNLPISTTKDY